MNITFETFNPEDPGHVIAAHCLGDWSRTSKSMLTLDYEQMQSSAYSLLAFNGHSTVVPAGHIAVKTYEDGHAMVGGYVVNPYARGQGVGGALLGQLVETAGDVLPDMQTCIAYVNQFAISQFVKVGGVVLGGRDHEAPTGCNTVIDLMPAIKKIGVPS